MDVVREEKLLVLEVKLLSDETMKRCTRILEGDDLSRRTMAIAQVAACRDLMTYLRDNEDWSDFGEMLEATAEGEYSRYRDAVSAGERDKMIITLTNVRVLRRLMRRLTNPQRRQTLLATLDSPSATE